MEPILLNSASKNRNTAQDYDDDDFELSMQEVVVGDTLSPLVGIPQSGRASRMGSSPGGAAAAASSASSMTIGPRGGKEGKVMRCEKCGNFFYSQRGITSSCPDCRVQLGYAIPPDGGVNIGWFVYFPTTTSKSGWTGGRIVEFFEKSGEFLIEIADGKTNKNTVKVAATSVAPPGRDTGAGKPWEKGTSVVYLSGTYGTWIPAYVENFNPATGVYDLDVKAGVAADKLRARLKRLADQLERRS